MRITKLLVVLLVGFVSIHGFEDGEEKGILEGGSGMLSYIKLPLGINIVLSGDHPILALHCHFPLRYTVLPLESTAR